MIAAAAATVLVGAGVAVAAYLTYLAPEEAPRNPRATLDAPDPAEQAGPKPAPPKPKADDFVWRHYGYSKDHRRFFAPPASFRGPFLTVWKRKAPALLEFPPVMARESIFQLADNGQLASLRKKTGKVRWKKKLGRLAASAPALGGGRVYVTLLEGGRGAGRGRVVALRQRNGKQRWSRTLPSRSESSPLLHGGRLYFGTRERDALLPRRRQRQGDLDLPRGGRDQGQPDARPRQAVLRRLRRARPGRARVQRPPRLVGRRCRADLRDRGGRGRPGVPRQPVGAGVRRTRPGPGGACGRTAPGATSMPRRR